MSTCPEIAILPLRVGLVRVADERVGDDKVGEVSITNLLPVPVWDATEVVFPTDVMGPVKFALVAGVMFVRAAPFPENAVAVTVPFTCKAVLGVVVPIPTFPPATTSCWVPTVSPFEATAIVAAVRVPVLVKSVVVKLLNVGDRPLRSAFERDLKVGVTADPVEGPAKKVFALWFTKLALRVPEEVTGDPLTEKTEPGKVSPTLFTPPPPPPPEIVAGFQ
jgi:hypothetical protein